MPSIRKIRFREVLLSLVILTMTASASFAADISVNLTAMQTTMTMPGGEIVTVWVFAQDGVLGDPALPGPVIQAQAGDNLTINLTNQLSVPVSMYINGQRKAMDPVWTEGTITPPVCDPSTRKRLLWQRLRIHGQILRPEHTCIKAGPI